MTKALVKISDKAKLLRRSLSAGQLDLQAITQLLDEVGAISDTPRPVQKTDNLSRVNKYKTLIHHGKSFRRVAD